MEALEVLPETLNVRVKVGQLNTRGYGAYERCQNDQEDDTSGVLLAASVAGRGARGQWPVRYSRRVNKVCRPAYRRIPNDTPRWSPYPVMRWV